MRTRRGIIMASPFPAAVPEEPMISQPDYAARRRAILVENAILRGIIRHAA
jgi:hypothetical protein